VLVEALGDSNVRVGLHAANALDYLDDKAKGAIDAMKNAKGDGYTQRTISWALEELGVKSPAPAPKKETRSQEEIDIRGGGGLESTSPKAKNATLTKL
jgi:hypothetical protein